MEAPEIHRGERLRRRSFRGETLIEADFSGADLRGADFTHARLAGASFRDARLGVTPLAGVVIVLLAMAAAAAAGIIIGFGTTEFRNRMATGEWQDLLAGTIILVLGILLLGLLYTKGFDLAMRIFALAFVVAVAIDFLLVLAYGEVHVALGFRTFGLLLLFGLATVAGIMGRVVGGVISTAVFLVVTVVGGLATGHAGGGIGALFVGVLLVVVARRALNADIRDRRIARMAYWLFSRGGTKFAGADVSNTDFTGTVLALGDRAHVVLSGATWSPGEQPLIVDNADA